jgi:hypothetical protein
VRHRATLHSARTSARAPARCNPINGRCTYVQRRLQGCRLLGGDVGHTVFRALRRRRRAFAVATPTPPRTTQPPPATDWRSNAVADTDSVAARVRVVRRRRRLAQVSARSTRSAGAQCCAADCFDFRRECRDLDYVLRARMAHASTSSPQICASRCRSMPNAGANADESHVRRMPVDRCRLQQTGAIVVPTIATACATRAASTMGFCRTTCTSHRALRRRDDDPDATSTDAIPNTFLTRAPTPFPTPFSRRQCRHREERRQRTQARLRRLCRRRSPTPLRDAATDSVADVGTNPVAPTPTTCSFVDEHDEHDNSDDHRRPTTTTTNAVDIDNDRS